MSLRIYRAYNIFLPVYVSSQWLNHFICLFFSFLLSTSGVWLFIDKSGLACCLDFTQSGWRCIGHFCPAERHWRTICTVLQPMGSKCRYLKKCLRPYWPIWSRKTWTKYTPLTLLSQQRKLKWNTFCVIKSLEHLKNLKNGPGPYLILKPTVNVIKSQIHLLRRSR
jgi:hypothetical protein